MNRREWLNLLGLYALSIAVAVFGEPQPLSIIAAAAGFLTGLFYAATAIERNHGQRRRRR